MTAIDIARFIDHTVLKPDALPADIDKLCREAAEFCFAAVCIAPCYVERAVRLLGGTEVKVCTVAGFPLGSNSTGAKAFEAREAVCRGAREVDMVLNIGALKNRDDTYVQEDIGQVVRAVKEADNKGIVKVIIETCFLDEGEKTRACILAKDAGADFVKTSTGFGPAGATVGDVRLMRKVAGDTVGVKAAGGIRAGEQALAMIEAGANRIGTSAGVQIVTNLGVIRE